MSSLTQARTPVQQVLRSRPYLQDNLIPLAVFLCEEGYSDGARNVILSSVRYGTGVADLVRTADLEPADLRGARGPSGRDAASPANGSSPGSTCPRRPTTTPTSSTGRR